MKSKINLHFTSFLKFIAWVGGMILAVSFFSEATHAQSILGDWDMFLNDVPGFAPTGQTGEELAEGFVRNLIAIVRNVVGVAALIVGVYYALRLVLARGQEDVISKQRLNFFYILLGFIILIISENVANIFNPVQSTAEAVIDFGAARDQLRDIVDYVKWLVGSAVVLWMGIVAFRMVTAGDDEEAIKNQKSNLTWGMIGFFVILLADNIVNAIYVINAPDEITAASPEASISELSSLIRLVLVFVGPIAIAFTIYAGFLYLTALDNEERANQAKRMITGGIVAVAIIYASFALINTFVGADISLLNPSFFA